MTAPGATTGGAGGGPSTSAGATAVTGAAATTTTPGAGSTVASAATTQATAPAPVLGRPIDDGTGLRLGYVPAEYGLAGVQGWPADAQEGSPRTRALFLNGPGGQVDVVVARDTGFEVPAGASAVTVQGRPGYTATAPQATVAFTPAEGVVLTVTGSGLPLEELTRMAEGLRYDAGKDGLPER